MLFTSKNNAIFKKCFVRLCSLSAACCHPNNVLYHTLSPAVPPFRKIEVGDSYKEAAPAAAKSANTLLYNSNTQQDEAYSDPNLKKNQVAARVAQTTAAKSTVSSANTVQAAARGTVTGARLTAPKSPILQAAAKEAAPAAEPTAKKTISELAAAMKNALLHYGGSKNTIFDHKSQTDIPLTKKALVDAALQGGKGTSASNKKNSPYKVEVLEPKPMPLTKYGTKAIPMPTAKDEIYQLVAKLPDHFPFDEWDEMHPDAQREQIMKTKLTAEEQLVFLNADLPIGTLKEIQEIESDSSAKWKSKYHKENMIDHIWDAGTAIYAVKNNKHPLSYDRSSGKIIIDLIYEDIERIIKEAEIDQKRFSSMMQYHENNLSSGNEILMGEVATGTLIDHSKESLKQAKLNYPVNAKNGVFPHYRITPNGDVEKNTINVFYTASSNANFSNHANYQKTMLEKKGYHVVLTKVSSVDEFSEAWDNMDESTKAALIFVHSNGDSLIFEENSPSNAMSWYGRNNSGESIDSIHDLKGPEVDEVYLMSCNTANEMLMEFQGSNVADAFRDLPNVSKVYGYDGSMSFPDTLKEFLLGYYDPRLSDDSSQKRFQELKNYYKTQLTKSTNSDRLSSYDGWFLYTDEED